jgi:preprotein translocase subunit YajC
VIIIVYLVILAAAFFFLIVLPQRRRMAAHQRLMAGLEVGDEIVTAGGFHGTIRALGDTTIMVEIAPTVVVEVARGAISARVSPPPPEVLEPPEAPGAP